MKSVIPEISNTEFDVYDVIEGSLAAILRASILSSTMRSVLPTLNIAKEPVETDLREILRLSLLDVLEKMRPT